MQFVVNIRVLNSPIRCQILREHDVLRPVKMSGERIRDE